MSGLNNKKCISQIPTSKETLVNDSENSVHDQQVGNILKSRWQKYRQHVCGNRGHEDRSGNKQAVYNQISNKLFYSLLLSFK